MRVSSCQMSFLGSKSWDENYHATGLVAIGWNGFSFHLPGIISLVVWSRSNDRRHQSYLFPHSICGISKAERKLIEFLLSEFMLTTV